MTRVGGPGRGVCRGPLGLEAVGDLEPSIGHRRMHVLQGSGWGLRKPGYLARGVLCCRGAGQGRGGGSR